MEGAEAGSKMYSKWEVKTSYPPPTPLLRGFLLPILPQVYNIHFQYLVFYINFI